MPPRGSGRAAGRGAQSTRGARGGRGRGAARGVAAPAADEATAGDADVTAQEQRASASSQPTASSNVESSEPTPNPTSTAQNAPNQPSATEFSASRATSSQPGTSSRGALASGVKFRPKGVRRSEAERDRITQEQEAIQTKRLAEDARQKARASRSRGRGRGRGRGGFSARGGMKSAMAAGPLAQGFGFGSSGGGYGAASSNRGGGGSFGADRKEGVSEAYDPRINADMLYNHVDHSDEEDEPSLATASTRRKKPLMPMGIPRVEHKEEKVAMATAAEIEARDHGDQLEEEEEEESDENLFVDGPSGQLRRPGPVKDEDVWEHAAPKPRVPVKIKRPDGSIAETMEIDEIAAGKVVDSNEDMKDGLGADVKTIVRKTRKRAALPKDPEEEELAERLERNLAIFGPQDEESHIKGEPHPREGKVFLFQLPPILPPLSVKKVEQAPDPVKPEPNDDIVMLDQPANGTPVNVDLTNDDANEAEDQDDDDEEDNDKNGREAGREWPKTGGLVGKLVVRKSGKVTLDYGGTTLVLEAGIQTNFLSTAILLHMNDAKPGAEPQQMAGTAYGMGKIEGKFVCAPVFSEPEPWVIDPKELEPPAE